MTAPLDGRLVAAAGTRRGAGGRREGSRSRPSRPRLCSRPVRSWCTGLFGAVLGLIAWWLLSPRRMMRAAHDIPRSRARIVPRHSLTR